MTRYKNNNDHDLVFPSLFDADGNVLVVAAGETFDSADAIVASGVDVVAARPSKSAPAPEPAASDDVSDEAID